MVRYGDNDTAHGSVFTDKVTLGSLTVTNQAVEAAANVNARLADDEYCDGLLGLGFVSCCLNLLMREIQN